MTSSSRRPQRADRQVRGDRLSGQARPRSRAGTRGGTMPQDVAVLEQVPEPAGTLARLVRAAGGEPVVLDPGAEPGPAPLVLAQWPLDAATRAALARAAVALVLVCPGDPGPDVWRDAVQLR